MEPHHVALREFVEPLRLRHVKHLNLLNGSYVEIADHPALIEKYVKHLFTTINEGFSRIPYDQLLDILGNGLTARVYQTIDLKMFVDKDLDQTSQTYTILDRDEHVLTRVLKLSHLTSQFKTTIQQTFGNNEFLYMDRYLIICVEVLSGNNSETGYDIQICYYVRNNYEEHMDDFIRNQRLPEYDEYKKLQQWFESNKIGDYINNKDQLTEYIDKHGTEEIRNLVKIPKTDNMDILKYFCKEHHFEGFFLTHTKLQRVQPGDCTDTVGYQISFMDDHFQVIADITHH